MLQRFAVACALLLAAAGAAGTIFGTLQGTAHDPQHRPIAGAKVTVRAAASQWSQATVTDADGYFRFPAVPLGEYTVEVGASGFAPQEQRVTVASGSAPMLHFPLALETVRQSVEVSAEPAAIDPESTTSQNLVSRREIAHTPGADRANSLAMITNFVPGAVVAHDQLHVRGGHQTTWMIDGVPVPNTNIASNVGPQFDPRDIDYLEVQRGGLSAEAGDRTFGVFNVVTRSGFERSRQAELVLDYGSFNSTHDQLSFGSHTERFAYYASLAGNRTDLGLETPAPAVLHDLGAGLSAFTSLIYNRTPRDQLRLAASARGDHYQVPNDPGQQAGGTRDADDERDAFANFTWLHSTAGGAVFTVSPYYHFNRAAYAGGPLDTPFAATDQRSSHYAGVHATAAVTRRRHRARFGADVFGQHDASLLALVANDGSGASLRQTKATSGSVAAVFAEDRYELTDWLTLNGGVRLTRFAGDLGETAADPRLGAALRVPRLHWVLRGFYGHYYQPPPLTTVAGPVADFAVQQGFGFLPLHGERDHQYEFGLGIPAAGWALEFTHFRTAARNYFDHDVLGNSNVFFPLTIARARIRGWEASLRSPRMAGAVQLHLAYANQQAQARGGVTGGLTSFEPPADAYFYLDHDQRQTLSLGLESSLPWHSYGAAHMAYGSGFLDGDGPGHLPAHTTADVSLGKEFERFSLRLTALNLFDRRYLIDNSNTFGGTHWADPRQLAVEVRYRFKY